MDFPLIFFGTRHWEKKPGKMTRIFGKISGKNYVSFSRMFIVVEYYTYFFFFSWFDNYFMFITKKTPLVFNLQFLLLLSERDLSPESCLAICHPKASCLQTSLLIKKLSVIYFPVFASINLNGIKCGHIFTNFGKHNIISTV